MKNIKLIISYEGTNYLGWQKTKMGPSLEESLEKALYQVLRHPVKLQAASRTDAGVHALGQVVNFLTPNEINSYKFKKSLNSVLPKDISLLSVEERPLSFHPTLEAKGKEYHYHICTGSFQLPFYRHFSWHFPYAVNVEEMKLAAKELIGSHNFSAFSNEKTEDNVREIFNIDISLIEPLHLQISVAGNRFLYKMVRTIVGTLVYIGCGKIKRSDLRKILTSQDRTQAGVTAPACGLLLKQVFYDK